jgi:TonB family protein
MGIRDLINQKPYDSEMGLPLQPPNVIANNQGLRGENENIPPSLAVGAEIARRRQEALMAALKERAISLQNDRTNTSDEEARKNYVNWAVAVKAENKPETLNIAGIYPKDACLRRLSGSAVYGVLANAQGRASNVELIKSSGYPILNQQAIAQINSLGFPNATGNSKPYTVNVSFNYDRQVCPSYGTAPTPSIEATKSPEVPDNLPENTNPQLVKPEVSPNPPVEARKEPPEPNNQATPVNPPLEARKEPIEPNNQPTPVNPPVEARKEPVAPPDTQTPPPPPESTAVQPRDEEKNLAPAPAASVKVPEDSEMSPTAPAAPPKMETTEVQN